LEDENTLGPKSEDIQGTSCECSEVYKGQTSHSIETSIKEHHCHYVWLHKSEKSADRTQHWQCHYITIKNIGILARNPGTWSCSHGGATEIELYPIITRRTDFPWADCGNPQSIP